MDSVIQKPNCCVPNCQQPSKFRCPTCVKLKQVENSYFCSQTCFSGFWTLHKLMHTAFKRERAKAPNSLPSRFSNFKFTGTLRPWMSQPRVLITDKSIVKPDYALTGVSPQEENYNQIKKYCIAKTEQQIADLRECSKIARKALDLGHSMCSAGVTTEEIDTALHTFIIKNGGYPSPLNYYGFPKSICTSVNEVICHGIPDKRPLQDGDIVNLDITVYLKGFHSDLNETYIVGSTDKQSVKLIKCAYDALQAAIKICKPGVFYRRVGDVIGEVVEQAGFSIVRTYSGHGVGQIFHAVPNVSHYPNNKNTGVMKKGHVFTIEPMINTGVWQDVTWPDNWTSVTKDGKRSAQFEHTLMITEDGVEVLTARLEDSPRLKFMAEGAGNKE